MLGVITSALIALVTLLAVYYGYELVSWLLKIRRIGKQVDKFPGLPAHWLFGNLHQHPGPDKGEDFLKMLEDFGRRFSPVVKFRFGPSRPSLWIIHPDSMKVVLKHTEQKSISGKGGYSIMLPWLGNGLLLSSGPVWHRNRKLLTPAFHFDVLQPYIRIYNEASDTFVENLRTSAQSKKSTEIFQFVCLATLNIILRCAFSYDEEVQKQGGSYPYAKAVINVTKLVVRRFFQPLMYFDTIYRRTSSGKEFFATCDYVHRVADEIIAKRKQELKSDPSQLDRRYRDFLDILLLARDELGQGLTDSEIRQEVDTFLFEGHDTTASGISWCLYHLADNPGYQSKAREEVQRLLHGRESNDITWEDLKQLPYLSKCVKEGLRMGSPVPIIEREVTKPFTLQGIEVLPGTFITLFLVAIHHNEKVWGKDHNVFDPERFSPENINKIDSHAFVPFSAGSRNCIGQNFALHEIKIMLCKVLLNFNISVDRDHDLQRQPELVMRAKHGIKLFFEPRKATI